MKTIVSLYFRFKKYGLFRSGSVVLVVCLISIIKRCKYLLKLWFNIYKNKADIFLLLITTNISVVLSPPHVYNSLVIDY